jgi:hypothetical protein
LRASLARGASEGVEHVRYLLRLAEQELIDRERHMAGFCSAADSC